MLKKSFSQFLTVSNVAQGLNDATIAHYQSFKSLTLKTKEIDIFIL